MMGVFRLFLAFSLMSLSPVCLASDLDLSPVALFKCWRAFKKLNTQTTPTIPSEFSRKIGDQTISVPNYTYLRSKQIEDLFKDYPEEGGAQAMGITYRTVDGRLTVLFWPKKQSSSDFTITHREAIEAIIQSELRAIDHYISQPRNEKIPMLLEARENLSGLLAELKSGPQIPEALSERFVGFQINARKLGPGRKIKIESIDFDPVFNGKSSIGSLLGWTEEFEKVIKKVSNSISTGYRPELYRVDEALLNSYLGPLKLKAPIGSKVIGFTQH